MPTHTKSHTDVANPRLVKPCSMGTFVLIGAITVSMAGCGGGVGAGFNPNVGVVKVGGDAKLVSFDGADLMLDPYVAPAKGKSSKRSSKPVSVEKVKLPAGTIVVVKSIVGDDARVEVKDGADAGSNFWIECGSLEPIAK